MKLQAQDLDYFLPVSCKKALDGTVSHVICIDKRTRKKEVFTMSEIEEAFGKFSTIKFLTGKYPE